MSQIDDLLAQARRPGTFVERRSFTMNHAKALQKQREYALRHPSHAVLELVQGAVFHGATTIAVETRPEALVVAWVGAPPLDDADLENLLDWLFADRAAAATRHLVQLAVGINALLQRRPRALFVETGDGERSFRVDIDPSGASQAGRRDGGIAGTYVVAEFTRGWLARFTGPAHTVEQGLVEERCLYTPVPILLNGAAPFGYRASRHIEVFGAVDQRHFDEAGRRGVVATHDHPDAPKGFRIVVGGVWVTTLALGEVADRPLMGVVCDDALRKTADHGDIVQDGRYVQLLHALQPHATELLRATHPGYRPPRLPEPVAEVTAGPSQAPRVVAEPLPEQIPAIGTRRPVHPDELADARSDVPLFYVEPAHAKAMASRESEPDRFPWRLLVLSEGQALTLGSIHRHLQLHRLTAVADLDFVRRVLDRQERVRTLTVPVAPGMTCTLRLHLEGRLPDWGHGGPGTPWCLVTEQGTVAYGVVDRELRAFGGPPRRPEPLPWPLDLPGVSMVFTADDPGGGLSARHLSAAVGQAWRLAVPERGDPHPRLLAALLGAVAVPQLVSGPGVAASLPVDWPATLRHVPLCAGTDLTLQRTLDLIAAGETVELPQLDDVLALDALEARFGYGHLTHPLLDATPVVGVGRIGERWVVLSSASMWSLPGLRQMCWVGATLRPRDHDADWVLYTHPAPHVVTAHRRDVEPEGWDEGLRLLQSCLERILVDRDLEAQLRRGLTLGRVEGMIRLALAHLTVHLDDVDRPLLQPADQGGQRSLREAHERPAARVSARFGAVVADPWTFLLTLDELRAIQRDGRPALRHDDDPTVWASLTEGDDGWLIRQSFRDGGLVGWLGLRFPADLTGGVLLRSTHELVALAHLEESVPCHGLLWAERDDGQAPGPEQQSLVHLAALRLMDGLARLLTQRLDPARREAAERYAIAYVARSPRPLKGPAATLAQRVEVRHPDGMAWGTLAAWFDAPADRRPPLPAELLPPDDDPLETALAVREQPGLSDRLREAVAVPGMAVHVVTEPGTGRRLRLARAHAGLAVFSLDDTLPEVAAALAGPGRARELMLLEMARLLATWAESTSVRVDLLAIQQRLVAQRLA